MYQPKRPNAIAKNAPNLRSPKPTRKHTKVKQIKSKIFKNLCEFPITLPHDAKENQPSNQPSKPNSSLTNYDTYLHKPTRNIRVQSALGHYPQHRQGNNRKRLSLDSTGKKYERDSLISRNSMSKKMSRNNKSIEQGLPLKIAEERRKSNISCASAYDEGQYKASKKHSVKHKRPSASNLHLPNRTNKDKQKENKEPKNTKIDDKSRSKSKKGKKKIIVQLEKSKGSTATIILPQRGIFKKKQSISTVQIGIGAPKRKKKAAKKKSSRPLCNHTDQFSQEQYPINKYDPDQATQKLKHPASKPRTKSKSRKGSSSKQRQKASSILQIDYMSCMNIPSNSSGLIDSHQSKISHQGHSDIKIMENWSYNYFGEENVGSVNLDEIRYYQSSNYSHKKEEKLFLDRKFSNETKYHHRRTIQLQLLQEYPHFGQLQLKFVSSLIFIQRKWREHRLYKQIFRNIATSQLKMSHINLEQSNSTQLNISHNKLSPEKIQERYRSINDKQIGQASTLAKKASLQPQEQQQHEIREQKNQEMKLKNNFYLQYKQGENGESNEESYAYSHRHRMQQQPEQSQLLDSKNGSLTARSQKYEFLQRQLFPSMSYILVKRQQLKQQLTAKLHQYSQLQRIGAINGKEYHILKQQSELIYQQEVDQLNKSKKDMKKGYLSFIDTYKNIKQQSGLRRVSSENGPMAALYLRIFNLQGSLQTPSQSSQSMKILTKKVLIRRQFFRSQKIEPNILNATIQNTQSARQRIKNQEQSSLSARIVKKSQFVHDDASNQPQPLRLNRIKQGFIVSPQFQFDPFAHSPQPYSQMLEDLTYERKERQIMEQVITIITHELFVQLIKIDEKRQNAMEIISEGSETKSSKIKVAEIRDFEVIQENKNIINLQKYQGREQDFQVIGQTKFREIFKLQGLPDRSQAEPNRKHRKSNTYNISPAPQEPIPFQSQEILTYAKELIVYIKQMNLQASLATNLNFNQGFTPKEYLKFLRDFEIPDEDYQPLISNEIFVQWEDIYYNGHQLRSKDQQSLTKRQAATIFHRCIFQCLIGFLQDHRPSGEKGDPFPWQNIVFFKRILTSDDMSRIFEQCIEKLETTVVLKSGIIEQKHMILSEQDLQRLHEQNQDQIINMLEKQLEISPHNWYQLQQHCLEIKLEIELELFQYTILQALDQFLQLI